MLSSSLIRSWCPLLHVSRPVRTFCYPLQAQRSMSALSSSPGSTTGQYVARSKAPTRRPTKHTSTQKPPSSHAESDGITISNAFADDCESRRGWHRPQDPSYADLTRTPSQRRLSSKNDQYDDSRARSYMLGNNTTPPVDNKEENHRVPKNRPAARPNGRSIQQGTSAAKNHSPVAIKRIGEHDSIHCPQSNSKIGSEAHLPAMQALSLRSNAPHGSKLAPSIRAADPLCLRGGGVAYGLVSTPVPFAEVVKLMRTAPHLFSGSVNQHTHMADNSVLELGARFGQRSLAEEFGNIDTQLYCVGDVIEQDQPSTLVVGSKGLYWLTEGGDIYKLRLAPQDWHTMTSTTAAELVFSHYR